MRFSRFFGGGRSDEPEQSDAVDEAGAVEAEEELEGGEDGVPEGADDVDVDADWRSRARDVIPGGASTGSKRAEALYGEGERFGPTHFVRASGCHVVTAGGRTIIDCTMALGAVAVGYGDESITRAVMQAAGAGSVSGLSHTSEVEVAERLVEIIPCAEQVRFLKSGAEAVAAAVRLARTYTARSKVVGSGYFGWHDWASDAAGVPAGTRADFTRVPFDDLPALELACERARDDLAAVVIEPVVERLPTPEWVAAARALCDRYGAVLIFDEVKTGFRLRPGGYQELAGVEPDLAAFGKAMANGYPVSAVAGRAAVMEVAERTWISSTLAGEATALAATAAVLDHYEQNDVCDSLATIGDAMREAVQRAIEACGIAGVTVEGIAPMWFLRFDSPAREARFLALALEEGVLFKRGPYNFASLAHDEETIIELERVASTAFVSLAEELDE
jgi:glutamate-1-semialdehyde 2,1-aminomutase